MVELLVVIAIIAMLAAVAAVALGGARTSARDTKRKADLARIGQLLSASDCYLPTAGEGDYDLVQIAADMAAANPDYARYASMLPRDPKTGGEAASNYRYQVTADKHCVLYANLEKANEPITLPALTAPAPNSGSGALKAAAPGPNGSDIYYQISK